MRVWLNGIVIAQAVLVVTLSAWFYQWLHGALLPWVAGIAWSAIVPLIWHGIRHLGDDDYFALAWRRALFLLPWVGFCLLIIAAAVNAAYALHATPDGPLLVKQSFIPWLPMSINRWHTLRLLFLVSGLMVLAIAIFRVVRSRTYLRVLLTIIGVNDAVLALWGVLEKLFPKLAAPRLFAPESPTSFATFDYHNHWAAFCLLNLGVGLALADRRTRSNSASNNRRNPPFWACLLILVFVISIPLSTSRSGMILTTVLGVGVALRAWQLSRRSRRQVITDGEENPPKRRAWVPLLGLFIFAAVALYAGRGILQQRWHYTEVQIEQIRDGQRLELRPYLARDTLRMALARPWFGWGLGSFTYVFPLFAGPEFGIEQDGQGRQFDHAHNDWIQLWAETGATGFLLFWAVPVGLLFWLRRQGRFNAVSLWLLAGASLVFILGCWDYPSGHLANPALITVVLAVAARYAVLERVAKGGVR